MVMKQDWSLRLDRLRERPSQTSIPVLRRLAAILHWERIQMNQDENKKWWILTEGDGGNLRSDYNELSSSESWIWANRPYGHIWPGCPSYTGNLKLPFKPDSRLAQRDRRWRARHWRLPRHAPAPQLPSWSVAPWSQPRSSWIMAVSSPRTLGTFQRRPWRICTETVFKCVSVWIWHTTRSRRFTITFHTIVLWTFSKIVMNTKVTANKRQDPFSNVYFRHRFHSLSSQTANNLHVWGVFQHDHTLNSALKSFGFVLLSFLPFNLCKDF